MELDLQPRSTSPCVLAYARFHGLCSPYDREPLQPVPRSAVGLTFDLDGEPCSPDISDAELITAATALGHEKIGVNTEAAALLYGIGVQARSERAPCAAPDAWERVKGLKVELPVLRTDAELDLVRFGKRVEPVLGRLRIPSEKVDVQNDEGLEWPERYAEYIALWDERAKGEKLRVSGDAMRCLEEVRRGLLADAEWERCKGDVWRDAIKPVSATSRCLTPPLLPLSPPLTPYVPSSPVSRIELAPESSSSVAVEASMLDDEIMAADTLEHANSDNSDSMLFEITHPPPLSPRAETSITPILKRKAEDLKVEGPLTPPIFSDSPSKKLKSVSFSQILHEFIPKESWGGDASDREPSTEDGFDEFFDEIEPLVKDLERKVENEQLTITDTMARPKIPDVDFTLPVAPWDQYSLKKNGKHRPGETELFAQAVFLRHVKNSALKAASKWPGISVLERHLPWNIFTAKETPKVSLEEVLHGKTELDKVVAEFNIGPIATSEAQVWKKEGVRVLDMDDDEEELEPAEVHECDDVESWVRKRKLDMDADDAERLSQKVGIHESPSHNLVGDATSQIPAPGFKPMHAPKQSGTELMFGGFSARTALQKFMETRGQKMQTTTTQTESAISMDPASAGAVQELPNLPGKLSAAHRVAETKYPGTGQVQVINSAGLQVPDAKQSLPPIPSNLPPCSFIISMRLLQQRTLIKKVEQLYPAVDLVYRDYNLPHSAASEADIVLSPSTGLIFTTLQHLKQRALPGQPDRSPVKERMKALHLRYERLIVMTSQGPRGELDQQNSSRPEDPRDKEALSEFERFAAKLEGEVLIKCIRGGEEALAHSIVVEMIQYGLPHGSKDIGGIKPLASESNWELFLRRAGFNPFAAQVILASLKNPYDMPLSQSPSSPFASALDQTIPVFGLPAFILMSAEERVSTFQVLMGGGRILRSINGMLDREWVSAVHGFRM